MKRNSIYLTSPAYLYGGFVSYDTVAVYRHFGGVLLVSSVGSRSFRNDGNSVQHDMTL